MTRPPTFMMTDASLYDVAYRINPWMRPGDWQADPIVNRAAAMAASSALRGALVGVGADVTTIPAAPGVPDLVFPANAAVVLDGKVLLARFHHPVRALEEPHFRHAFQSLKDAGSITSIEQIDCVHEGAGDCIWDATRQLFWVGSGPRSSADAGARIARYFGRRVVELPLATDRFYHLDTCFCPLSGGQVLYYPPALTTEALDRLRDLLPPRMLIEATAEDAAAFCVNAVSLGDTVVMAEPPPALRGRLSALGYKVVGIDLAPFILSGGGAFCMTLRLDLTSTPATAVRERAGQQLEGEFA